MVNNFKLRFCAGLGIVATLTLSGCATPVTMPNPADRGKLLRPLAELTGARPGAFPGGTDGRDGYIRLRYPTAVSARGNDVYLVDVGLRRIFRYDRAQQTLARFANLTPDAGTSVYAAPDFSVYVIDPAREQVLHFTRDGVPLPSLSSPGNLARPVSVAVEEVGGRVLVADGLYDQIVVFNSMGRPLSVIKSQQVRAVAAIALGPDGIYVVDRLTRQVVVLDQNGAFRQAFGAGELIEPTAIAVSRDGLVFVGDNFSRTVKAYRNGLPVAEAGGAGAASGSFSGIGGLAVDESNLLYVTDSQNARVQIMMINPRPAPTGKEK